MATVLCPTAGTLAAFVRGELPVEELGTVAEHLEGCAACSRALEFVPEDSLAGLARAAAAAPDTVRTFVSAVHAGAIAPGGRVPDGFVDHPRYRIIGQLGAGGMGTVYKAEDLWMGRIIALKIVSPQLTAKESAVERFRKEIRFAAQLNDPRVIIAHDTGEAGGCQFLVMEYVDGFSLDKLVGKKGPLSVPMACAFARHAALGLQHAAEKGMVHRDIKPQNLMVTRKGQIKILDFGLARFAHSEVGESEARSARVPFGAGKALKGAGLTNPHMLMGTPDYLSPEQARNSHDVDHRSDIYSLGCSLYFLLTGTAPFASASTLIDKLLAHTHEEPPSPRDARPEIPTGLEEVLARMMAKRPEERYQTAAEVAAALLPFTRPDAAKEPVFEVVEAVVVAPGGRTAANTIPAALTTADTAPVAQEPTLTDTPRPKRLRKKRKPSWWRRRKGTVISAALVLLFLGVAGAVANSVRKRLADPQPDPAELAKAAPQNVGTTKADPAPEKNDPNEKSAPTVIAPPSKGVQILFVLPTDGLWLDDFIPVRDHLTSKGATVVTAAVAGGTAKPARGTPGSPVAVDVILKADMDLSVYAAVLFCGERCDEYMRFGAGAFAAGKVIQRMQDAGKPVGAICVGGAVLASHGVLKGKRVAHSRYLAERYPFLGWNKMNITWDKPGVTVDGKIVTASGPREAVPFADAVLKLVDER